MSAVLALIEELNARLEILRLEREASEIRAAEQIERWEQAKAAPRVRLEDED